METLLAQVVQGYGEARPREAYLFANRRANRIKILVQDGFGLWLAVRRLQQGYFLWLREASAPVSLTRSQFDSLVLGLPWQHLGDGGVIRVNITGQKHEAPHLLGVLTYFAAGILGATPIAPNPALAQSSSS
jgi:transposase